MMDLGNLRDLAQLFENLPDVQFWIKDRNGRFLAANKAFLNHFGMTSFSEMEGKTDLDISPSHLARDYIQDDTAVLLANMFMPEKMELVQEKDQSLNWYATTKTPLRNGNGLVIGTAGMTRRVLRVHEAKNPSHGMDQAIEQIHRKYSEHLTISGLAKTAGLSIVHFERKFRQLLRETPLKYLNRIRMRSACGLLLHTDLSVGQIAAQCGYSDQSYFTKRFFTHLRIRPLDYRKKYG
jgi:PAS domain S-box-containing protein